MKIRLVTDSTCDLTPEYLATRGVYFESLKVLFGDVEYTDKIDLTATEFYKKMAESPVLPTTSQVNPNAFEEKFLKILQQDEHIIAMVLSSELSGTYSAASIAKSTIEDAHPEYVGRITLVDSRTTSFGLGLLVILAQDLIDAHKPLQEIIQILDKSIDNQQLYGLLHGLDNLVKGGRLSAGSAMIGNLLNVKPIIEVKEGKVNIANKVRGAKKGMQWMIEQLTLAYPSKHIPMLGLAHANNLEKIRAFEALLKESFTIDSIHILEIGPVVGTHVGADTIGVVYFK